MIQAMGVPDLRIPLAAVKFFKHDDTLPDIAIRNLPAEITLTSCQALKQTFLGDSVCLTKKNIGCVAAAISFGLVDQNDEKPLEGPRVYTDIMKNNDTEAGEFTAPTFFRRQAQETESARQA